MKYLIFLLFILVCMSGVASISVTAVFYTKFKKRIICYCGCFLGALLLLVIAFTAKVFIAIIPPDEVMVIRVAEIIYRLFGVLGDTLCIASMPFFFHSLVGIDFTKARKHLYFASLAVAVVGGTLFLVTGNLLICTLLVHPILFSSIGYCFYVVIKNYSVIGDPVIAKSVKVFIYISAPFIPLILLDASSPVLPLFPKGGIYSTLTLPAYFFAINVMGIFFSLQFFDRPAYYENDSLTEYFAETHSITTREKDIIAHLLNGQSNKEIGEALFISHKTVENHLSRIYQKTGVKNRLELVSLVQTNRA